MSTDAARTKLRELIATKQQWLRQWQAPELLSPGRSDMIQVLSDNIAELQQVLAELDKAEPQEPDSPERRCGGPGCDMKCCQPVQEPIKLRPLAPLTGYYDVGGKRVWLEKDEPFPQPTPPQRKPLSEDEKRALADKFLSCQPESYEVSGVFDLISAVERAHGIGGEHEQR